MTSRYDRCYGHASFSFRMLLDFTTPMLAVFAVDIAVGKDAEPLPALLTTSDAVTDAAAQGAGVG